MSLFVDTSAWSLALHRDDPGAGAGAAAVDHLRRALGSGASVYTTGFVLQELLQGFHGPQARDAILERFATLPLLVPSREDHVAAAALRTTCRRHGVQVGTIDALLAQLCLHHDLLLLTTDADFRHMTRHVPLRLWRDESAEKP